MAFSALLCKTHPSNSLLLQVQASLCWHCLGNTQLLECFDASLLINLMRRALPAAQIKAEVLCAVRKKHGGRMAEEITQGGWMYWARPLLSQQWDLSPKIVGWRLHWLIVREVTWPTVRYPLQLVPKNVLGSTRVTALDVTASSFKPTEDIKSAVQKHLT